MLTVVEELRGGKVNVRCDCGTEKTIDGKDLRRGHTRSCGCARRGPRTPKPIPKGIQDDGLCRCCDNEVKSRGLCGTCYNRAVAHGNLDEVADPSIGSITAPGPESPFWKGDTVDYDGAHKRIARMRGSAKSRMCAESCGRPATQWSYDGFCSGERVDRYRNAPYCYHYADHYQPRCLPCHRDWDRDQIIVADQV